MTKAKRKYLATQALSLAANGPARYVTDQFGNATGITCPTLTVGQFRKASELVHDPESKERARLEKVLTAAAITHDEAEIDLVTAQRILEVL